LLKRKGHCVETLTGFKYIGAKLEKYSALPAVRVVAIARAGAVARQKILISTFRGRRKLRLQRGRFCQGQDANGAAIRSPVTAYARSKGLTLISSSIVFSMRRPSGKSGSLIFEGAGGADKFGGGGLLQRDPPDEIDHSKLSR
jgi:phosphoglucomutase